MIEDVVHLEANEPRLVPEAEAFANDQVDVPRARPVKVVPLGHRVRIRSEVGRALDGVHVRAVERLERRQIEEREFVRTARWLVAVSDTVDPDRVKPTHAEEEPVCTIEDAERVTAACGEEGVDLPATCPRTVTAPRQAPDRAGGQTVTHIESRVPII